MKATINVFLNFIVETVRPPGIGPVRNRNGLAELVQLQTATTDCIHNGSIVNDLVRYALLFGAYYEIGMCGGAEWIANH